MILLDSSGSNLVLLQLMHKGYLCINIDNCVWPGTHPYFTGKWTISNKRERNCPWFEMAIQDTNPESLHWELTQTMFENRRVRLTLVMFYIHNSSWQWIFLYSDRLNITMPINLCHWIMRKFIETYKNGNEEGFEAASMVNVISEFDVFF